MIPNDMIPNEKQQKVFPCSVFYGAFVWARRAPNRQKRRFFGPSCRRVFVVWFTVYDYKR
jgi:hypothetical protein